MKQKCKPQTPSTRRQSCGGRLPTPHSILLPIAQVFIDRKYPDMNVTASMLLSVSGCIIAAAGDLSFDSQGYTVALVCAALQATYMMLAEAQTKGKAASSGSNSSSSSPSLVSSSRPGAGGYFGSLMTILHKNAGMSSTGVRSEPSSPAKKQQTQQHQELTLLASGTGTGLEEETALSAAAIPAWADSKGASSDGTERLPLLSSAAESEKAAKHSSSSSSLAAPKITKTSPFEILYYMGIVGCPLLLGAVAYSGELEHALVMFQHQYDILGPINSAIWMFWIASVEGMLTGCMIWCAQVNNALTTSIVGVLKGVFATLLGFFLLGGIRFSVVNVTGICITLVGGSWYTWIGYCNTQKKKAVAARELSVGGGSEAVDPVSETAPLLASSKV